MPQTFKEFLEEQAEELRKKEAEVNALKREWTDTILGLFDQMKKWLEEVDEKKVLKTEQKLITRSEHSLGTYEIPCLSIALGGNIVYVEPVALNVVAPGLRELGEPRGRVDLKSPELTYKLYRFVKPDGQSLWAILDDRSYKATTATTLDKETFETALLSLFQ